MAGHQSMPAPRGKPRGRRGLAPLDGEHACLPSGQPAGGLGYHGLAAVELGKAGLRRHGIFHQRQGHRAFGLLTGTIFDLLLCKEIL